MTAPSSSSPAADAGARVPSSLAEYLKSMGPGLIAVLTWLGAGDIVNSATAGGNYGYALMWVFALCLFIRYLFVSMIAKYQLCNQHHESLLSGLHRLHPLFSPFILVCTIVLGHAIGTYILAGMALATARLAGFGNPRFWAVAVSLGALAIAFRPVYRRIEKIFFVMAALLTVSLLGLAVWTGPSWSGLLKGIFGFQVPEQIGRFDAQFIMLSLVGAVGGGIANMMYPYFVREKGWSTPAHRRVQQYDLIFGIVALIVLDLSVWVIGAEILHPRGLQIFDIDGLAALLGKVFGAPGRNLFYVGIMATLFSTIVGNGAAFGYLGSDAWSLFRSHPAGDSAAESGKTFAYRSVSSWVVLSPLFWILAGNADFIGLTLLVNAAQVVIIPVLVGGLWMITARAKYIGAAYRNSWWENAFAAFLLLLSFAGAFFSFQSLSEKIYQWMG